MKDEGGSTQKTVERAASTAGYVFTAPRPWKSGALILPLSLLLGFATDAGGIGGIYAGLIYFALPALLAGLITQPLAVGLGGRLYFRRSFLLALIVLLFESLVFLLYWLAVALSRLSGSPLVPPDHISGLLIFSSGLALYLWYAILLGTSAGSYTRSLPPALVHPLLMLAPLAPYLTPALFLTALLFLAVFAVSCILFCETAKAPFRRNFGVNGLDMMRHMLSHWTEGEDEGREEMERFFGTFGTKQELRTALMAFRRRDGSLKAVLAAPAVHPGPFGNLAGSSLPEMIAGEMEESGPGAAVLVAHGPCTHDENPVDRAGALKAARATAAISGNAQWHTGATPPVRRGDADTGMCLLGQGFGPHLLLLATSSPAPTDDIDSRTGHDIVRAAAVHTKGVVVMADAHNCLRRGSGMVLAGTRRARALIRLAGEVAEEVGRMQRAALKVGTAARTGFDPAKDAIGPAGVKALVVDSGEKRTAYIVFDSNNMVEGLRERIVGRLKKEDLAEEAEILTSDTHTVNATMGGYNPVGMRLPPDAVEEMAVELCREAAGNMEEVEAGAGAAEVEIKVFGHGSTARLTATINATIAGFRASLAASAGFAVGMCWGLWQMLVG